MLRIHNTQDIYLLCHDYYPEIFYFMNLALPLLLRVCVVSICNKLENGDMLVVLESLFKLLFRCECLRLAIIFGTNLFYVFWPFFVVD